MALGLSSSQKQGLRKRGLKISHKANALPAREGEGPSVHGPADGRTEGFDPSGRAFQALTIKFSQRCRGGWPDDRVLSHLTAAGCGCMLRLRLRLGAATWGKRWCQAGGRVQLVAAAWIRQLAAMLIFMLGYSRWARLGAVSLRWRWMVQFPFSISGIACWYSRHAFATRLVPTRGAACRWSLS